MASRAKVLSMEYVSRAEQSMESILSTMTIGGTIHEQVEGAHSVSFGGEDVLEAADVNFTEVSWAESPSEPQAPVRYRSEVFSQERNLLSGLHVLTPTATRFSLEGPRRLSGPDIALQPVAQPESEPASNQQIDTRQQEPRGLECVREHDTGQEKTAITKPKHRESDSEHHVGVLQETTTTTAASSTPEQPWLDKFLHEHLVFEKDVLVLAGDMKDLLERHLGRTPVMEAALRSPGRVHRVCKVPERGR